jgi:predicted nucleotidyltransferase component of viral defense system
MNLHKNKDEFLNTLIQVNKEKNIALAILEKDYYVTLLLKEVVKKIPNLVFKGGTSLSKCYKIINSFSEDIDLTIDCDNITQGIKRECNYKIIEIINDLNLKLTNREEVRSRRKYNKYKIEYPQSFKDSSLKETLLIETVFMVKAYPKEIKKVSSIICDYWVEKGNLEAIEKYNMRPFNIAVQTLERTFIDKVFALCDYYLSNEMFGYSRHIYDLYKLYPNIKIDDDFKKLIVSVREDRKKHSSCISAKDEYNISELLKKIVNEKYYYEDYIDVTQHVLFDDVDYDQAKRHYKE